MPYHPKYKKRMPYIRSELNKAYWMNDEQIECFYCNVKLRFKVQATVDHIIPLSKNGKNSSSNCVFACKKCNEQKGNNINNLKIDK